MASAAGPACGGGGGGVCGVLTVSRWRCAAAQEERAVGDREQRRTTAGSRVIRAVNAAVKAPRAASSDDDATHAADSDSPTARRSSGDDSRAPIVGRALSVADRSSDVGGGIRRSG